MKTYLSYGGGVNSTACIVLHAQGKLHYDEAIYVDHGCDWPETREYVRMMAERFPITILKPDVEGFDNLYDYFWHYQIIPWMAVRFCTMKFKVGVIEQHIKTPCFMLVGIDAGEQHRAKISNNGGVENRFPLIEAGVGRENCKKLIYDYGLQIPPKSGCYFCPYQRISQWKKLRRKYPNLFCKAEQLEARNIANSEAKGKVGHFIHSSKKPLRDVVKEKAEFLFEEMKYPPCECEL